MIDSVGEATLSLVVIGKLIILSFGELMHRYYRQCSLYYL